MTKKLKIGELGHNSGFWVSVIALFSSMEFPFETLKLGDFQAKVVRKIEEGTFFDVLKIQD